MHWMPTRARPGGAEAIASIRAGAEMVSRSDQPGPRADVGAICVDLLACASAWDPATRLLGNVRADEIAMVADKARAVDGMRPALSAEEAAKMAALADRIRQLAPFDCVSTRGDGKATLSALGADVPNAVCSSPQVAYVLQDALIAALTGKGGGR